MRSPRAGITLIEMLIVVALVGILAGISFPAVSAGIDSLRLTQASDGIVTFLNTALNRADRRQQVMEITVSIPEKSLTVRSSEAGYVRSFVLPAGVTLERILPGLPGEPQPVRRFYLYPGGAVPRIGIEILNLRGASKLVRVDPISGAAQVETLPDRTAEGGK